MLVSCPRLELNVYGKVALERKAMDLFPSRGGETHYCGIHASVWADFIIGLCGNSLCNCFHFLREIGRNIIS